MYIAQRLLQRPEPPDLYVTVSSDEKKLSLCKAMGNKLGQQQGRTIGPMQVIKYNHHRLICGGVLQKGHQGIEQTKSGGYRIVHRSDRGQIDEMFTHVGHYFCYRRSARLHLLTNIFGVVIVNIRPNYLDPGPVERSSLTFVATAPQHLGFPTLGKFGEFNRRSRNTDSGLSHKHGHPAPTRINLFENGR